MAQRGTDRKKAVSGSQSRGFVLFFKLAEIIAHLHSDEGEPICDEQLMMIGEERELLGWYSSSRR